MIAGNCDVDAVDAKVVVALFLGRQNHRAVDAPLPPHFEPCPFPKEGARMTWNASILEVEVTAMLAAAVVVVVALVQRAEKAGNNKDTLVIFSSCQKLVNM